MAIRGARVELVGWRGNRGRFVAATRAARAHLVATLRQVMVQAEALAVRESPVGRERGRPHFRDSYRTAVTETKTGAIGVLENTAPHAGYVIYPTRPHVITARNARVLRFEAGGRVVYRRRVFHPGTKGNDIPRRVAEGLRATSEQQLRRAAARVQIDIAEAFR